MPEFVAKVIYGGDTLTVYWAPEPAEPGTGDLKTYGEDENIIVILDADGKAIGAEITGFSKVMEDARKRQEEYDKKPKGPLMPLEDFLKDMEKRPMGKFRPYAYYSPRHDSLDVWWTDTESSSHWMGNDVMVQRSWDDEKTPVGFRIEGGVSKIIERAKELDEE